MKRLVIFCVLSVLVLAITACGGNDDAIIDSDNNTTASPDSTENDNNQDSHQVVQDDIEYGNMPGNSNNNGYATIKGDRIYYTNLNEGNIGIYSMNLNGGDIEKLNDDRASGINVVDDRIYYCKIDNTVSRIDDIERGIYSIRIDGSDKQRLNEDDATNIIVVGNQIFYSNLDDKADDENRSCGKLYAMKTDGSDRRKLNDCDSEFINVVDNVIYYSNANDDRKLSLIDLSNGNSHTTIHTALYTNVVDNLIYFNSYLTLSSEGEMLLFPIRVMDIDNLERAEILLEVNFAMPYTNVADGKIYACGYEGATAIFSMNIDGSDVKQLNDGDGLSANINVVGDWIFYNTFNELYIMRTDGSEHQLAPGI